MLKWIVWIGLSLLHPVFFYFWMGSIVVSATAFVLVKGNHSLK